jgi:hypothetical protein
MTNQLRAAVLQLCEMVRTGRMIGITAAARKVEELVVGEPYESEMAAYAGLPRDRFGGC